MKPTLLALAILLASCPLVFGQGHSVDGTVTGPDGSAIAGITIQVKGTNTGTATDASGHYQVTVAEDGALVFRGVGFAAQEIQVNGKSTIDVTMAASTQSLNELVVTALGITREKKALGYAQQQVEGDDLSKSTESNVLNSLSGRIAGAQITSSSGSVGASSRIVLRGNNSFTNNQPLFIVDGTPVSNYTTTIGGTGTADYGSAVDYGNGIADIDPNNIESVNVLKGANAAALYGSRAANGVIIITTKTGKGAKGIGVTYSGAVTFERPYILPDMQNKYGQGYKGGEYYYELYKKDPAAFFTGVLGADEDPGTRFDSYQEFAQAVSFAYVDGLGGGVNDNVDESWGPRLDDGLKLPQYNSPLENGERVATPWRSHPNNIENFFRTGITVDNHVALTANTDKSTIRMALSNQTQQGTVPNTDQKKNTVELSGNFNLTDRLSATGHITYVRTDNDNLPGTGYNTYNVMQSIGSWFGRQVDMQDLEANWKKEFANGYPYSWNSAYHDNPYFNVYKNVNERSRDRVFGNVSVSYKFSDWAVLMGRVGTDYFIDKRKEMRGNKGNLTLVGPGQWGGGQFTNYNRYLNETNADLMLNGQGDLSDDFSLSYTLGTHYRNHRFKSMSVGANQLTVPDFYNIGNVKGPPVTSMYEEQLKSNSIYGRASFGYKNWLFLDITGRNDWSSTLPSDNWSYFYPSFSLSWIFTDALDLQSETLSYGKLRASWAQVGNATNPYQLGAVYLAEDINGNATAYNGVSLYHLRRTLPPLNLKPEAVKSAEFGVNLGFWDSRLNLDATYYDKVTTNQIMQVDISSGTGYNAIMINAGEIESKGVEIQLNADILRSETGLNWNLYINWAKNSNTVNRLYTDPNTGQKLLSYNLGGAWSTTVDAIPGQAFGAIRGKGFLRDSASGAIIVNADGLPQFTAGPIVLGNVNPDWTGGIGSSFKYHNFTLGFLFNFRKGGDIFSVTDWFSSYTGVLAKTAVGDMRENGVVVGQNVLKGEQVVMEKDGKLVPNDIRVSAEDYWHSLYTGRESAIIDGSFIKLRELSIGYTLPAEVTNRWGWLKGANIMFIAHNLALLYTDDSNSAHIDPEAAMGSDNYGLGIEQYNIPSNRSLGVRLNLSF